MMKVLLPIIFFISFSQNAFAVDDCLRYMSHAKRAEIIYKKKCDIILQDNGKNTLASIDLCFTKIKHQFHGNISWGIIGDLVKESGSFVDDTILFNSKDAIENPSEVIMDAKTMAPELLFQRTNYKITYHKLNETLAIKIDQGHFKISNKYNFILQCH